MTAAATIAVAEEDEDDEVILEKVLLTSYCG